MRRVVRRTQWPSNSHETRCTGSAEFREDHQYIGVSFEKLRKRQIVPRVN